MSKVSGNKYERQPLDHYQTPPAATLALLRAIEIPRSRIWEPCTGGGKMVTALRGAGHDVIASDVHDYGVMRMDFVRDFLSIGHGEVSGYNHIITNPPYGPRNSWVIKFIDKALELRPRGGIVAMLLPVDYDSGITRSRAFMECPYFRMKVTLLGRIQWFDDRDKAADNHAWFVWGDASQRSEIKYEFLEV